MALDERVDHRHRDKDGPRDVAKGATEGVSAAIVVFPIPAVCCFEAAPALDALVDAAKKDAAEEVQNAEDIPRRLDDPVGEELEQVHDFWYLSGA